MSIKNTTQGLSIRWRQLANGTTNRRIFRALVIVGSLTFGVKLASMVKDIVVADSFGAGDAMDAFLIAFLLPTYIVNVVGGSFNAALIPVYIETQERESRAAAQRLFLGVMVLSTGLLALVTALLVLVGPSVLPLLGSRFGSEKLALTQDLFYMLLPTIIISGLATIWAAALNAGERFALTSLASITVPITSVVSLLILGSVWGIYSLAFGIAIGFLLQLYWLGEGLKRQGVSLWPRWYGVEPAMRRVIGQYLPMVAGAALMSSTLLVDQAMAAMLQPGSVAALNYGNKIVALVLGVGTMALATAALPYFSKMVVKADWNSIRHSLKIYSWLILLFTVPFTLLVYVMSKPLVALLYQHGAFTEADTLLVSRIQAMYVLQVPFYTLGILFVRLISSLQANYILMWGTVISFILNITLDYLLMRILGVAGIALSTTLVYVISCVFLWVMLRRKLKQVEGR
jgi:putative peptidoglycan lipid II flippase